MKGRTYASRQRLVSWLLLPPAIVLEALALLVESGVLILWSGVFAWVWVIFTLLNWRCPKCHHLLPVVGSELKCEKCGYCLEAPAAMGRAA